MALTIVWSKKADQKFDSILEFLESKWGDKTVKLYIKKVFDFLDTLVLFPEIGTIENKELNIRGFVVTKQLTLFYQIRNTEIVLLNFYDNRQKRKKY